VAQVHQGGQQPVDDHQPMPGTARPPLARPTGQPRVLAPLPARPQFRDQLSEHFPGQPDHPAMGDSGGTGQASRHTTILLRA
jgi:hypothetical protein